MSKFYRVKVLDSKTTCPVCGTINTHITGQHCGHLHKITANGLAFYYWGFRPPEFKTAVVGEEQQ